MNVEIGAKNTRTEALLASPDFEPLLDRLEKIIETAAEKSFGAPGRQVLKLIIVEVGMIYEGIQCLTDEASRHTLHELAAPLARVIELLQHDANLADLLVALGAPATLALSPDQQAVTRAVTRYEALLRDLDDIARAVPPPQMRRRGKPPRKDLRALVEGLADYWVRATGLSFTQHWHKGEPLNHATQFVHAAAYFIDPECLGALPKMTEEYVRMRRAAAKKTSRSEGVLQKKKRMVTERLSSTSHN